MLNVYFAFGVPLFLLLLYLVFAYIRKKSTFHYIGFILLLIASFMTAFSFQVLQGYWSLVTTPPNFETKFGYSAYLLWLPLIVGFVLSVVNVIRGIRRILLFSKETPSNKP